MKFRLSATRESNRDFKWPEKSYIDGDERFIDIGTIDELLSFVVNQQEIVVSSNVHMADKIPSIEIYNDYRE